MKESIKSFIFTSLSIVLITICLLGFQIYKEFSKPTTKEIQLSLKSTQKEPLIFMSKADNEDGEIYLYQNNETKRLTYNSRHENNPALSPDGKKIAFHAGELDNPLTWEIYILEIESKEETRLTSNNVIDGHPDWSPDGTKIVYSTFKDSFGNPSATADIFIYDLNTGIITQLIDNEWEDNDPEWSPDGNKIAFKSTRNSNQPGREEIFIINSDGTDVKQLSHNSGWESDHDPSWSPDGQKVVFSRFEGKRIWMDITNSEILQSSWKELFPWNIFLVDLDGNETKLTNAYSSAAGLPVFTKDNNVIGYWYFEPIISNTKMIGADHELHLIDIEEKKRTSFFSDKYHSPTLEYWDW